MILMSDCSRMAEQVCSRLEKGARCDSIDMLFTKDAGQVGNYFVTRSTAATPKAALP